MSTKFLTLSPSLSEYAFSQPSELDLTSLFEQCGIPFADLNSELHPCSTLQNKETSKKWYNGAAPKAEDLVDLNDDSEDRALCHDARAEQRLSKASIALDNAAEFSIDGLGKSTVSLLRGPRSGLNSDVVSATDSLQTEEHARRPSAQSKALCRKDSVPTSSPASPRIKNGPAPTISSARPSRRSSPLASTSAIDSASRSTPESCDKKDPRHMNFYSQQQYYSGAQLSSPISMQSLPDNESLLYTSELSSPFSAFAWQDPHLSALVDSESMRRSMSTPFLGDRASSYTSYGNGNANLHLGSCVDLSATLEAEEVVPASVNSSWRPNQGFWTPTHDNHLQTSRARMPISATRPTMQRKHRPLPISTTMPRSSASTGPHTAPIGRGMITQSMDRPVLSAKRSFEDISDFHELCTDAPPYRHISTPISKRTKSSQGFDPLSSPFVDEPLFSPVYNDNLASGMDPEQFLLSPPYNQTDFCSSPNYLVRSSHDDLQSYLIPNAGVRQEFMYNTPSPVAAIDVEGSWVNNYSPQRSMHMNNNVKLSIPRNVNHNSSSPMHKTTSKSRRASTARAISFCNYTAADKKTILSGVAPSGSNKKAVAKSQEMTRSRSSAAIAV